ncbi:hypothetical protein Pyn_12281 [Prunus yedoensis var. nudiflora]|uniref:Uncharacterized protein n=1 Tax=Prunus yedoensis var. nudiflora TaxID=2094558 RepID=A0A314UV68_PRUYE|nr:hypothetical protein Pyn_12281 [Prunus yedoensis var. nudiflora]
MGEGVGVVGGVDGGDAVVDGGGATTDFGGEAVDGEFGAGAGPSAMDNATRASNIVRVSMARVRAMAL